MVKFPLLILLFLLASAPDLAGQGKVQPTDWSAYARANIDGIVFRWRNLEVDETEGGNFIAMEFKNLSGRTVEFFYVVVTDAGEALYGIIELEAERNRLFGWYFEGLAITQFQCGDPDDAGYIYEMLDDGE